MFSRFLLEQDFGKKSQEADDEYVGNDGRCIAKCRRLRSVRDEGSAGGIQSLIEVTVGTGHLRVWGFLR